MKKDQTNPKSRSKKNLGEIEAIVVSDEQDAVDDSGQALAKAPARDDIVQGSPSESPAAEEQE